MFNIGKFVLFITYDFKQFIYFSQASNHEVPVHKIVSIIFLFLLTRKNKRLPIFVEKNEEKNSTQLTTSFLF